MNVGLIGYGYWGPKVARNLLQVKDCQLLRIADINPARQKFAQVNLPETITSSAAADVLHDEAIESVIISSYPSTHYTLAKQALEAGKHVLVEKPFSPTEKKGYELMNLAEKKGLTLMVDYTYLYSNAILEIKELLQSPGFEDLLFIEGNRSNFVWTRTGVNVLYDLASHDLSILLFLLGKMPVKVRAISHAFHKEVEQVVQVFLTFPNGCNASLYCSWISPNKVRSINFIGAQKTITFNDLATDNKVEVLENNKTAYLTGNDKLLDAEVKKTSLYIKQDEPLFSMVSDFRNCVRNKTIPRSSMYLGLDVVRILEKAAYSMQQGGIEVNI